METIGLARKNFNSNANPIFSILDSDGKSVGKEATDTVFEFGSFGSFGSEEVRLDSSPMQLFACACFEAALCHSFRFDIKNSIF